MPNASMPTAPDRRPVRLLRALPALRRTHLASPLSALRRPLALRALPALLAALLLFSCYSPEPTPAQVKAAGEQAAAASAASAAAASAAAALPPSALPPAPLGPAWLDTERDSVRPGINEPFLEPGVDLAEFTKAFEGESREIARQAPAIVAALGASQGMAVADVGAGTGLFMAPLAAAVGPQGIVYELDISPAFLAHLRERAQEGGFTQVNVLACTDRSLELPDGSLDMAFVCDTYHHFEYPREALASIRRALRPGGKLVVVDFERLPGLSRDWVLTHVRAGKSEVRTEIESSGYRFIEEVPVAGLTENYMLRFERP